MKKGGGQLVKEKALLEALFFAAGEPVTIKKVSEITGLTPGEIKNLFRELRDEYRERNSGLELREVAGGFLMSTRPSFAPYIKKLQGERARQGLSQAAMETLAIIAYKQPITRLEIEAIRGVKVDKVLDRLKELNLIAEAGRKEVLGRPILYATTREFLKHFGLRDLSQLPSLEDKEE